MTERKSITVVEMQSKPLPLFPKCPIRLPFILFSILPFVILYSAHVFMEYAKLVLVTKYFREFFFFNFLVTIVLDRVVEKTKEFTFKRPLSSAQGGIHRIIDDRREKYDAYVFSK